MKIAVFFPSNQIAVDQQSSMWLFKKMGHEVTLITLQKKGNLHQSVEKFGVTALGGFDIKKKNSVQYYFCLALKLNHLHKRLKFDLIIGHLQACIFSALIFNIIYRKSKFIAYRHYSDNAYLSNNKKEIYLDKIINRFSKTIIVPSIKVKNHMELVEKVNPKKINLIPYGYNFDFYPKANSEQVIKIKERIKADLVFCTIARLVTLKRHEVVIKGIAQLNKEGFNVKAIFVGTGPELEFLKELTKELNVQNQVFFEGFKTNIFDYIAASDLMILLSNTEASNNSVKEAAWMKKTVMICNDVGDFNDYTKDLRSAFLLNKDRPLNDFIIYTRSILNGKYDLTKMGEFLHKSITETFLIDKQESNYSELFNCFSE